MAGTRHVCVCQHLYCSRVAAQDDGCCPVKVVGAELLHELHQSRLHQSRDLIEVHAQNPLIGIPLSHRGGMPLQALMQPGIAASLLGKHSKGCRGDGGQPYVYSRTAVTTYISGASFSGTLLKLDLAAHMSASKPVVGAG